MLEEIARGVKPVSQAALERRLTTRQLISRLKNKSAALRDAPAVP
jgi:hypothetical protein